MNDRPLLAQAARLLAASILAISACLTLPQPAQAAPPPPQAAPLSPADAQQLLSILNDPAKLAALKTTLANLGKAVAASPPAKPPLGLPQNSLGAQLVETLNSFGAGLAAQGRDVVQTLHVFGAARPWATNILGNPALRSEIAAALIRLALVLGVAFGLSALLALATRRPTSVLARLAEAHRPPPQIAAAAADEGTERARHSLGFARMLHALQLLPLAIAHLILQLVPIAGFALVASLAEVSGLVQSPQNLVVIQSALGAFVIGGAFMAATRTLFAPAQPALRLVLVRDAVAQRISFWLRLMVITIRGLIASRAACRTSGA
jgi:hypothetical protein